MCGASGRIPGASGGGGNDTPPEETVLPGMAGTTWFRLAVGADCGNGANLPALGDASMFVAGQIFPVLQLAPCEARAAAKVDSAFLSIATNRLDVTMG